MVTIEDYVSQTETNGFLGEEGEGLSQLNKAIQAGQITGRDTTNQVLTGEPLKAESLEKTLKLLEFRQKDIKLWNSIPKLTAYNTVEEFLQLKSYGNLTGGFYDEGELSDVQDSQYVRKAALVKYMQVTGEVTIQAQMVSSYVDAMRKETENKMLYILKLVNSKLTSGDSDVIRQEFDGIYKQHASVGTNGDFLFASMDAYMNSTIVYDLRNSPLTQNDVENAAVAVDANYGSADTLYAPTTVISGISKDYFKDQRIILDSSRGFSGTVGTPVKQIDTTLGSIALMADKFMKKDGPRRLASPSNTISAPPSPASLSVAITTDAQAKTTTGEAGTVFYAVSAINKKGESSLTPFSTAVSLTVGHRQDLTIVVGTSSANPTQGYRVYRTKVTAASTPVNEDFFPLFKVSISQATSGYGNAGAGVVGDLSYFLPDTEEAFICEMSEEVLSFKQLAPISKLDLAVISMSRRFIAFLFGTPQVYTPGKIVRFINIKRVAVGVV